MRMFLPLLGMLVALTACAPTPVTSDVASQSVAASPVTQLQRAPASPTGIPGRTRPAPPMSKPLPAQRVDASSASHLSTSCHSDSDCVVKNVGSCCGVNPACVNKNAKVDPNAVQAECAARGMASVCGFADIQSCTCDAGTCRGTNAAAPVAR